MNANWNDDLSSKINAGFNKESQGEVQSNNQIHSELNGYQQMDLQNSQDRVMQQLNFLNRIKMSNLINHKQRETIEILLNHQIERIKHKTEAAERESKAFWDAKSAEIREILINYVHNATDRLQRERTNDKAKNIIEMLRDLDNRLKEIKKDENLHPEIKSIAEAKIIKLFNNAISSIENNDLAKKYGLI